MGQKKEDLKAEKMDSYERTIHSIDLKAIYIIIFALCLAFNHSQLVVNVLYCECTCANIEVNLHIRRFPVRGLTRPSTVVLQELDAEMEPLGPTQQGPSSRPVTTWSFRNVAPP